MPDLEGMSSEELCEQLRTKWGLINEPNTNRANITAIVLDNQARHLDRLATETKAVVVSEWRDSLYPALKAQLRTHPLPDLCSIQPMTGPIGIVYFYRPLTGMMEATTIDESGNEKKVQIPESRLDIAPVEIRAESRRTKALSQYGADPSMHQIIGELLTEISREVLDTMLNCATAAEYFYEVSDPSEVLDELRRASHMVHRQSQRGPANNIIGNQKMLADLGVQHEISNGQIQKVGTLEGKWNVYLDPFFPSGKLMAWYQGKSALDTGIIYSPYTLVEITPNFVDPKDKTLRRAIRTRHKITLVRPEFTYLVQVKS